MLTISPVEVLRKIIFSAPMYGRRIGFTTQAVTTRLALFFLRELEQLRRASLMMLRLSLVRNKFGFCVGLCSSAIELNLSNPLAFAELDLRPEM